MTPDRYTASSGPKDPGSWNRYAYTEGDPVNGMDPSGQYVCGLSFMDDRLFPACTDAPPLDGGPGMGPCPGQVGSGNPGSDLFSCVEGLALLAYVACEPQQTQRPLTCEDTSGLPSAAEAPQLAVLLGENSWGSYPAATVQQEDLYMLQAMYNYATAGGYSGTADGVNSSINTDTYRGYPSGVDRLYNYLVGPAESSACQDLATAEAAYNQFWNGSHSFSNVNQWRAKSGRRPGRGRTRIAGTDFFYDSNAAASRTRPVRRPTPPIRLP